MRVNVCVYCVCVVCVACACVMCVYVCVCGGEGGVGLKAGTGNEEMRKW